MVVVLFTYKWLQLATSPANFLYGIRTRDFFTGGRRERGERRALTARPAVTPYHIQFLKVNGISTSLRPQRSPVRNQA